MTSCKASGETRTANVRSSRRRWGHLIQKLAEQGSMLKHTDEEVLTQTDQLKKTTIATVRSFKTKLTNAEDDSQQTSLHVCSISDILRDHLDKYKAEGARSA